MEYINSRQLLRYGDVWIMQELKFQRDNIVNRTMSQRYKVVRLTCIPWREEFRKALGEKTLQKMAHK